MLELKLNIKGMVCHGCENRLKNSLMQIPNIKSIKASYKTGTILIKLKEPLNEELQNTIIDNITNLGFQVI